MIEDKNDGWDVIAEFESAYVFIQKNLATFEEGQLAFEDEFTFEELRKYGDDMGQQVSMLTLWEYLLSVKGMSDEEFIIGILIERKEIYCLEHVSERKADYFRLWEKSK